MFILSPPFFSTDPARLQQDAKDSDTFAPMVISLKAEEYKDMIKILHLPHRAIEGTTAVGPFYWSSWDQDDDNPHLRLLSPQQWSRTNLSRDYLSQERRPEEGPDAGLGTHALPRHQRRRDDGIRQGHGQLGLARLH